jgi:hypothetical protein
LSHSISPFYFCIGYFWDRVSQAICLGCLLTRILLISASSEARIIGMSHWSLTYLNFVTTCPSILKWLIWGRQVDTPTHTHTLLMDILGATDGSEEWLLFPQMALEYSDILVRANLQKTMSEMLPGASGSRL